MSDRDDTHGSLADADMASSRATPAKKLDATADGTADGKGNVVLRFPDGRNPGARVVVTLSREQLFRLVRLSCGWDDPSPVAALAPARSDPDDVLNHLFEIEGVPGAVLPGDTVARGEADAPAALSPEAGEPC